MTHFTGGARKWQKGFTLIELLVVIAIIGVLSSVVLTSLNSARGKGNDAKVQTELSSARGSAEIYYSNQNPPSYTGICSVTSSDTSGMYAYMQGSNYPDGVAPGCGATATAYAFWHNLPFVGGYWCVDSTGISKKEAGAAPSSGSQTVCP